LENVANKVQRTSSPRLAAAHARSPLLGIKLAKRLPSERLGLSFSAEDLQGAVLQHVEHGAPGWRCGLCEGDVLVSVAAQKVANGYEAARALRKVAGECTLVVQRSKAATVQQIRLKSSSARQVDQAADRIGAHALGFVTRLSYKSVRSAAILIQSHRFRAQCHAQLAAARLAQPDL